MKHRSRTIRVLLLATTLLSLVFVASAPAAFPGQNGRIAFTSRADGNTEIYSVNPDGTDLLNLTNSPAADGDPSWSPDGRKMAFVSDREGPAVIFVMNADGSDKTRLTHNAEEEHDPIWSPDGTKIAFRRGGFFTRKLMVMNAGGGGEVMLAPGDRPSWSPDGSRLAFDTAGFDSGEIWVANADGTGLANLSQNGDFGDDANAAWSPLDDLIAYQSRQELPAGPARIFTVSADGGAPVARTGGDDVQPHWSPNGEELAFSHQPVLSTSISDEIHVIRLDGSDERAITDFDDGGALGPTWSPAGDKIAFIVRYPTSGAYDLYVIDSDGANPIKLSGSSFGGFDWQAVQDRDPECGAVRADPAELWPPNRALRAVSLHGATDPDGDAVALVVDSVTQDEPVVTKGEATSPDAVIAPSGELRLRAERNPHGDGRVYRIAFSATDGQGGSCSGLASISAPRLKKVSAFDSAPPSFDSLRPSAH